MVTRKFSLLIAIGFCFGSWTQMTEFQKVILNNNDIELEVPTNWSFEKDYPIFSDYMTTYSVKISDKNSSSVLTVIVYDSFHMYKTPITNDMLTELQEMQQKTKGASIKSDSKEIIKTNGQDVGVLRYTFLNGQGKMRYGIQMVFRTSFNQFYELDIYSLNTPLKDFKVIANRISNSLRILKNYSR
jgi:hypothetical protein